MDTKSSYMFYTPNLYTCSEHKIFTYILYTKSLHMFYTLNLYTCPIHQIFTHVLYNKSLHMSYTPYRCPIHQIFTHVLCTKSLHMFYSLNLFTCFLQQIFTHVYTPNLYTSYKPNLCAPVPSLLPLLPLTAPLCCWAPPPLSRSGLSCAM